jgi:hypothetical protein
VYSISKRKRRFSDFNFIFEFIDWVDEESHSAVAESVLVILM